MSNRLISVAQDLRMRIRRSPSVWTASDFSLHIRMNMADNLNPRRYGPHYPRAVDPSNPMAGTRFKELRTNRKALGVAIRDVMSDTNVADYRKVDQILSLSRMDSVTGLMDWQVFFEDKFSEYVYECNDCGHRDRDDDGRRPYDEDWVCMSCIEDHYSYSEYSDFYVHNDDSNWSEHFPDEENEDEEDSDDCNNVIQGRHSGKRVLKHIPSAFDERKPQVFLGMELEVEIKDNFSRRSKAIELYDAIQYHTIDGNKHKYIHIEDDGSLSNGFEMVTGWTGLDVHREKLKFFQAPWQGVRSHDTRTCGLHVHVSKANMTLWHGAKLTMFIHESSNQKLIRAIARRDNANYAQIKNKKASYQWIKNAKRGYGLADQLCRLNEERHEALNFYNSQTVEFRLFKGTLRYETQMACLEFAYMSWFFSRDTGTAFLTSDEFIKYICKPDNRKDTKFLRRYLKEKGFVLPKSAVVKDNPRMSDAPIQPIEEKIED